MHFVADTDTDENYFGLIFRSRYRYSCSLQFEGGHTADKILVGNNFCFIADTDTEKCYFRIISAMNSDVCREYDLLRARLGAGESIAHDLPRCPCNL